MFGRSKKPRKVRDENDLRAFETEDAYNRKKMLLDVAAWAGVVVLIGGLILLGYGVITNLNTRAKVMELIVNNIPGIIYGGLIVFGIKVHSNQDS